MEKAKRKNWGVGQNGKTKKSVNDTENEFCC